MPMKILCFKLWSGELLIAKARPIISKIDTGEALWLPDKEIIGFNCIEIRTIFNTIPLTANFYFSHAQTQSTLDKKEFYLPTDKYALQYVPDQYLLEFYQSLF